MVRLQRISPVEVVANDDSMSDDVFETESEAKLQASNADPRGGKPTPSPTGYRGYTPDPQLLTPIRQIDTDIAHKTILLGDSGVGKTSLLVQFDTGKFQAGSFSATVGIGFTSPQHCPPLALNHHSTRFNFNSVGLPGCLSS
ncbi:hypothetical protein GE061_002481 [Apolygus lucorum]|uniref:Ras-related protein Rab-26 n=1 Tax=Apolygus lucorum TaxID=248454 RepID=A0A8S9X731_APOLU|nr:hypothetical protein GE061_002481 [Apolygus lucorum]